MAKKEDVTIASQPAKRTFRGYTPTISLYEPLPDDYPAYALIGRVASEWAHYEVILDMAVQVLEKLDGPIGASGKSQVRAALIQISSIKKLAQKRGCLSEIEKDVEALEEGTRDPQEQGTASSTIRGLGSDFRARDHFSAEPSHGPIPPSFQFRMKSSTSRLRIQRTFKKKAMAILEVIRTKVAPIRRARRDATQIGKPRTGRS